MVVKVVCKKRKEIHLHVCLRLLQLLKGSLEKVVRHLRVLSRHGQKVRLVRYFFLLLGVVGVGHDVVFVLESFEVFMVFGGRGLGLHHGGHVTGTHVAHIIYIFLNLEIRSDRYRVALRFEAGARVREYKALKSYPHHRA